MATKHDNSRRLSSTESSHWRSCYLAAVSALITRHDGKARPATVAADAAAHADAAIEQLRARILWRQQ